jgi:CheY-like chemotaxis protein/HPt (histidine-containing phosphotransfer) domain-containing protein
MGGRIGVASRPGEGSTFWFELTLPQAARADRDRRLSPPQLMGVRALAVDDIALNLEILVRQLRGFGIEVTCCRDGFDGLAEIERALTLGRPYDIVFMDQMMPGMSGEMLADRVRSIPGLAGTRLVLISSAGRHGHGGSVHETLDAVLEKPLRQRDLTACLARLYPEQMYFPDMTASAAPRPAAAAPVGDGEALRILLAEDNPVNQKFAIALLTKAGHAVDLAENGVEAVAAVEQGTYDVVLMDVQMPELDGLQATARIRALPGPAGHIPIIALTAHALAGAREDYLAAGMNDFVAKPIVPAVLLAKLRSIGARLAPAPAEPVSARDDNPLTGSGIDASSIATLLAVMDRDEVREFIEMYLEEAGQRIERIASLWAGGEVGAVASEAHMLVGIAGNVGAIEVSDLARSLEVACRTCDLAAAGAVLPPLREQAGSSASALSAWLRQRAA